MNTVIYRLIDSQELIIVFNNGEPITIGQENKNFQAVYTILSNISKDPARPNNECTDLEKQTIENYASRLKQVDQFVSNSDLEIRGYSITYKGETLHGVLVDRILAMIDEDEPNVQPLINFLANLQENPSYRVRDQLFTFLDVGKNAITPDGHFLAYKYVTSDLQSCHEGVWRDGKFHAHERYDHSVGAKPSMPREQVNDDPNVTCSKGLHVCSRGYLGSTFTNGGHTIVACKVNPRDVVSVPTDYNNTKMRTCGYEVVAILSAEEVDGNVLASSSVSHSFSKHTGDAIIIEVSYDSFQKELDVIFRNGNKYRYYDVPLDISHEFLHAPSLISYFNSYIRDDYFYDRLS